MFSVEDYSVYSSCGVFALITYMYQFCFNFLFYRILLFSDNVHLEFHGQDQNPLFRGSKVGRLYLTTHRMVFTNKDSHDGMLSFSFPFVTISDVSLYYINWRELSRFELMIYQNGSSNSVLLCIRSASSKKEYFISKVNFKGGIVCFESFPIYRREPNTFEFNSAVLCWILAGLLMCPCRKLNNAGATMESLVATKFPWNLKPNSP